MMRFLLILLFLPFCVYPQNGNFRFHNYGFEDGLEASSVNTLAEDIHGFVWVGTDDGLYRFDGYSFRLFKNSHDHDTGLISNDITALLPQENGDLWVGTREGLHLFDSKLETFTYIPLDSANGYISRILRDPSGNLWIGSRNGLYRYHPREKIAETVHNDVRQPQSLQRIYDILFDRQGRLWISTSGNGVSIYDPENKSLLHLRHDPGNARSLSSDNMRKMTMAPDGRILIGTSSSGVNIVDPETLEITRFSHQTDNEQSLSAYSAFSFLTDHKGKIWIGTWSNGLNLFDPDTGSAMRFIHNPDDPYSIPHNSVISLMQSSTGDIWIGTDHGGLSRLNMDEQRVVRYQRSSNKANTMLTSYVRSVYEDGDGILWIGTAQNGLHKYDPGTGKFTVYLRSDGSRDALARSTIWSISPGKDNVLWLGTSRGVGKFNTSDGTVTYYEPDESDPSTISTNNILKVLDDGQGNLWIGTWYGGMDKMDVATGEFTHYVSDPGNPSTLGSNNVRDIFRDSQGRIWVADTEYLSLLDQGAFTRFAYDVYGIDEDPQGYLWLATGDGLIRIDPRTGECGMALREPEGLSTNQVNSVIVDRNGFVWAGTSKGVDRVDPRSFEIFHLDAAKGLAGNHQDARSAFYNKKTNRLYFGGRKGLSGIDPDKFGLKEYPPAVLLTDFLIHNKSVPISDSTQLSQSLHTLGKIRIDHSDRLVAIEFAGLNFHEPEKIRYAYKLEGFDEDWVLTDASDRKAVYTLLPYGTYTFKVRASNSLGDFSDGKITTLDVLVIPPWWKTWWAKALLYAGVVVLGYLLFHFRLNVIQQQNKRLEEQVRLRTAEVRLQKEALEIQAGQLQRTNHQKNKLFSIIGHDLRSPLDSLQGIMPLLDPELLTASELIRIKTDIGERIGNVKQVIENLLYWAKSQMEGEVVVLRRVDLNRLVQEKVELFEPEASAKNIVLMNSLTEPLSIYADKDQVRTVIHNLLGNAVKFTRENGTIEISAQEHRNRVRLSVRDTGIGMTGDQAAGLFEIRTIVSTQGTAGERGVGLGMLLIKEFVDKNNGTIRVDSVPDKGTTIHVEFQSVPKTADMSMS